MKALIIPEPGKLELAEIPQPEIGPYEALVKILACGICSTTDREIIKGDQPYHNKYPALLGHEAIGEVVALGSKVSHFKVGDLVSRPCAIWPGTEQDGLASGWGGFAEYGIVRDWRAMRDDGNSSMVDDYTAVRQTILPPGLGVAEGVLGIALAETASWLHLMPPVAGRTVCVSGTGIAGLSIGLWCKLAGSKRVIVLGRRDERLQLAKSICADEVINITRENPVQRIRELNEGRGVDFFAEAVGQKDQINLGLSLLAPGGNIGIYGVATGQQYDLVWSSGSGHGGILHAPANEHLTAAWVQDLFLRGWLKKESFPLTAWDLAQFAEAFEAVAAGRVFKAMLTISH